MGLTLNTVILRTPTGLLKILEIVLVLVCLALCRWGGDHGTVYMIGLGKGAENDHFLAVGTYVGYAIIVPCVLVTYLLGGNLTILELFINLIGAILFIATAAIAINERYDRSIGMVLGIMAIATGVVFLVDFIFAIRNTKFTVIQTTTRTI